MFKEIKLQIRTRRIGANPEKSDLVNFRGPDKRKFSELCVCCFSWEKSTKCSPNPGLVNKFSATPRGQLNWTGPIANSSDQNASFQMVGWSRSYREIKLLLSAGK